MKDNPEALLQATKKGRTLMTFVSVDGNPTRDETEQITKIWQTSLWNNHIQAERLVFQIFLINYTNKITNKNNYFICFILQISGS